MKNYITKTDKKTSTTDKQYSMFVGKWQPLHEGHQWLFQQALNEGKNVLICIRDVKPDDKNPYTSFEVKKMIEDHYKILIQDEIIKVIIIPDIESINYGRGVGYDIIEYVPPKDIEIISATKDQRTIENRRKIMKNLPHKKHIVKTITYRIFGTLMTVTISFCLGFSLEISSLIGLADLLFKPILYFVHETLWYKFSKTKE